MNGPAKFLMRGFTGRCPACGEGHLFRAFLKVADHCGKCGEPFRYHRADDFPAYLVIILVGHIVVPIAMWIEIAYSPSYWLQAVIGLPLIVGMSLGLLQPLKGAVVALQWHMGMHGFAESKLRRVSSCARSNDLAEGVEQLGDRRAVEPGAQACFQ
jgi:uncharacterized protein (DUF983 family)